MDAHPIDSVDKILEMAIRKESEAYNLYAGFARIEAKSNLRLFFTKLAFEEMKHEKLLREFIRTKDFIKSLELMETHNAGHGLIITDDLNPLEEAIGLKKAFFDSIEKEIASKKFYHKQLESVDDEELKQLLLFLIAEETKHEELLSIEMSKYSA